MTHASLLRFLVPTALGLALAHAAPAFADDSLTSAAPAQVKAADGQGEPLSLSDLIKQYEAQPGDLARGLAAARGALPGRDLRRVRRVFERAVRRTPKEPVPKFLAALAGGDTQGIHIMARLLGKGLDADAAVLLEAWVALREAAERRRAWPVYVQAAQEVLDRRKTGADRLVLAQAFAKLPDRTEDAIKTYEAVLAKEERNLTARTDLTLLLAEAGQGALALERAEETVTLFPNSASAYLYLGMVRSLTGDTEAGREAYAKALGCTDKSANALAAVAAAYTELEDYEHAEEALRGALKAEPRHAGALCSMAILELQRGRPKQALGHLNVAAKAAPTDARVQFLRGVASERCKRLDTAVSAYRSALRLQPERTTFTLALARALESKGNVQGAVGELRKALARAPDDARLHLHLGLTEMRRRRYGPALDALTQVTRLEPKDPKPWFFIAVIQGDHRSKPAIALDALNRYKELGGTEPTALAWLERLEQSGKKKKR